MVSARLTSKELKFLLVLAIVQFNHILDFMLMMPLGPQLMRELSIATNEFGYLVSSYTFSAAVSGLLFSLVMDRFDRKKLLIGLSVGFSLGTALCGLSDSYLTLLIARSVAGAFGGVLGAVVLAIVGDGISYDKRGFAMGIMSSAFSAASVLGIPCSLLIANAFGWHMCFLALSALACVVIFFIYFFIPHQKMHIKKNANPFGPLINIKNNPHLLFTLLFSAVLILGQFMVIPFLSPSLVANQDLLESQLPLVYLFGGIVTLVTGPIIGKAADRFGKREVFTVAILFAGVATLAVTHLINTPLIVTIFATTAFFIFVNARWIPAQAMITGSVSAEYRGSFMSYVSFMQHSMAGLGALISGWIVFQNEAGNIMNYEKVGYLSVTISGIAILLSRKVRVVEEK
jgi:MFS transporter, DHA1 family, inner membrane transport protein